MLDGLEISIVILGAIGSLWTTVYVLMGYLFDRADELEAEAVDIVYGHVFPRVLLEYIYPKAAHWACENGISTPRMYASIRICVELTPLEFQQFMERCNAILIPRRPWWVPTRHVQHLVHDLVCQYIWRVPMHDILHNVHLCAAPPGHQD